MNLETIDHVSLLRLVEAGAVRATHVAGQKGGWGIVVQYGMTQRTLATTRSKQVRIFKRLEAVVTYLKDLGISHFEVDAEQHDPADLKRTRPDRAKVMKKAHEAAAYTSWLEHEVQKAIDDPRPNAPHDDVMRCMDERIRAIKARKTRSV